MHIGCYYDSINYVYVIFTLRFMTMRTKFNQTGDRLDCLISMLFTRTPGVVLLIFNISFINTLYIGKSVKIKPDGIYQVERNGHVLTLFNKLEIQRRFETQPSNFLIMFFARLTRSILCMFQSTF
jgi:hypothetical protein